MADPRAPAPRELRMPALSRLIGVSPRAIRLWVKAGVVPRPPMRGNQTRYGPECVLRAQAAAVLVKKMRSLRHVKKALDELDENGLRSLAGLPLIPPPPEPPRIPTPPPPPPPEPLWETITLVPGLELRVREDATPFTRTLADAILRGAWLRS